MLDDDHADTLERAARNLFVRSGFGSLTTGGGLYARNVIEELLAEYDSREVQRILVYLFNEHFQVDGLRLYAGDDVSPAASSSRC